MNKILSSIILLMLLAINSILAQEKEINTIKSTKMKIEIWSDIVCPFCYIGKRHFEAALKSFAHADDIEVEWKSFQLDPDLPKPASALNVYEYLAKRKDISVEYSKSLHENVVSMAKAAGLNYNFDKAVVANSFDAHRLIQFSKTKGLGDAAEEQLFNAYFCEGKDICDPATLVLLGEKIGLEKSEVEAMLKSDKFNDEVEGDIYEAQQVGVTGVPFFVVDNHYAVSGAQPVSVFLQTLQKAYESRKK